MHENSKKLIFYAFFQLFCSITFEVFENVHFWKFHEKERKKLYNNDYIRYSKKYNFTVKNSTFTWKNRILLLYTWFLLGIFSNLKKIQICTFLDKDNSKMIEMTRYVIQKEINWDGKGLSYFRNKPKLSSFPFPNNIIRCEILEKKILKALRALRNKDRTCFGVHWYIYTIAKTSPLFAMAARITINHTYKKVKNN